MAPLIEKSEKQLPIVFRANNMVTNLSSNKDLDIGTFHTPLSNARDISLGGGGCMVANKFKNLNPTKPMRRCNVCPRGP